MDTPAILLARARPEAAPRELPWWCRADASADPREFLPLLGSDKETPLLRLPGLARSLGLQGVHVKDESGRLGLSSFKALGGAYAVLQFCRERAARHLGRPVRPDELVTPELRALAAGLVVCCASDGNHGRSVAAGARIAGARCVVFVHAGVSAERVAHIERQGASIVRVHGNYDDAVAAAAVASAEHGWALVADIADPGHEPAARICGQVMQGYCVLVREILEQAARSGSRFSHVLVQAGVGGLAAAVFGHWTALTPGAPAPRFVVAEPDRAACVMASARAGRPVALPTSEETVMAMLECQRPSPMAWPVLHALADAYVAVTDDEARSAVRTLAWPRENDPAVEAGESGAAGLAALIRLLGDEGASRALGLGPESNILLIATEGPTDLGAWSGRKGS